MDELIENSDELDPSSYPDPLPFYESEQARKQRRIESIKRVLAPYIMPRKSETIPKEDDSYFPQFLNKRPSLLMNDMAKMLAEGVEITTVLMETANVLTDVTKSTVATVYLVDDSLEEIYQIGRNFTDRKHAISYKIETGKTIAAHVAFKKEYVKVDDILADTRFPEGLGNHEITVKSVLCVPVVTHENDCLAVFELYRNIDMPVYTDTDLQMLVVLTGWVGSALYQNQRRINLQRQHELNDYILAMTNCYFANTMLLDNLISEITNFAKLYLDAEHAMFFLLKKKFDENLADLYEEEIGTNPKQMIKKCVKMNLERDFHFINMAVKEATLINIRNAYRDPRIKQDRHKGYMTRCILCLPIMSGSEVLGVFQLINKKHASCFSRNDEILFQSFAIYFSLILSYDREIEKSRSTNYLNTIYLDMMGHHVQPCRHDLAVYLNEHQILLPPKFNEFSYYPKKENDMDLPFYVVAMLQELSVNIRQDNDTPIRFVLSVKKSYRDNPYHNFYHAFNVCHCMYNILRRNMDLFTPVEIKALMVATLCHDIDHMGLTNNYLDITDHALARLYKDSPMENHHVNVTRFVTRYYELFNTSPDKEIELIMKEIREAILATDLSDYFMKRGKLNQIVERNLFDWKNEEHRMLLKSLMMTAADLSGACKPFKVAKEMAQNVYKEFYNEGDQEKQMNLSPMTIMNREKRASKHNDQIQFLNIVVLPCILMLTKFFPNCANMYKEAMHVRNAWEADLKNPVKKEKDPEIDINARLMRFDMEEDIQYDLDMEVE